MFTLVRPHQINVSGHGFFRKYLGSVSRLVGKKKVVNLHNNYKIRSHRRDRDVAPALHVVRTTNMAAVAISDFGNF